jgi:Smg protein
MFEVLVFVYENYWRADACPQGNQLERKLNAVGFETQEIQDALAWLNGLSQATHITRQGAATTPAQEDQDGRVQQTDRQAIGNSGASIRVFSMVEQNRLGADCLGFIRFLENAAVLAPHMREIVVDRAMACGSDPLSLDDLKIIVLMVYWSFGEEPDALVLDELCDDAQDRVAH